MQSVVERASTSICALVNLNLPALGVLQHCLVKLASVRLLLSDGSHIKAQVRGGGWGLWGAKILVWDALQSSVHTLLLMHGCSVQK